MDQTLIFKILFGLFIVLNILFLNIFIFKKLTEKFNNDEEDNLSFEDIDFNTFDIEDDIYSLNYLTTLIASEYVDRNVMNANENKSGHKRIQIPNNDKEHQENVDDITNMVMNVVSDQHIMYLEKYVDISRLKYIVRIYVKRIYNGLINEAVQHRVNAVRESESGMQSDNSDNKNAPQYIKDIVEEYGLTMSEAKQEALRVSIDDNKIKTTDPSSRERKYYNDLKTLKNYFTN